MIPKKLQSLFVKRIETSGMSSMLRMKNRQKPVIYFYDNYFNSVRRLKNAEKVRKNNY